MLYSIYIMLYTLHNIYGLILHYIMFIIYLLYYYSILLYYLLCYIIFI